ncbi:MAG TPA: hypothetical protein VIM73_14760, partial [Polyangiaceae bacterium]
LEDVSLVETEGPARSLPSLCNRSGLRKLYLKLTATPRKDLLTLGKLTALEDLSLTINLKGYTDEFADAIAALPNLRRLSLMYSQLDRLPLALTQMSQLEFLDLSHCDLSAEETNLIRVALPDTEVKVSNHS